MSLQLYCNSCMEAMHHIESPDADWWECPKCERTVTVQGADR